MQNVSVIETLAAPMYKKNPISLYLHLHIVNNPIPISSNITESQGNDPNVFHSSANASQNSIVGALGKTPSTSIPFLNISFNGKAPNTSNNGNVSSSNRRTPLPPPHISCDFTIKKFEKLGKKEKTRKQ